MQEHQKEVDHDNNSSNFGSMFGNRGNNSGRDSIRSYTGNYRINCAYGNNNRYNYSINGDIWNNWFNLEIQETP